MVRSRHSGGGAGRPFVVVIAALALLIAACTGSDDEGSDDDGRSAPDSSEAQRIRLPLFEIDTRAGPYRLTIEDAGVPTGTVIEAADLDGSPLATAEVAADGTTILRELPAGEVELYLLDATGGRISQTEEVIVPGGGPIDEALYGSFSYGATRLQRGLNYIPTRDGTTLSAFVTLPGAADGGPYPTLVEYSGYEPSRPDAEDPGRLVTSALGYALVQVNVRGTGCSGGSFDAFEAVHAVDGFDVIETVAAQDWSDSVGMYGISYAGIMQLLVAAEQPPSLDAIAPLSVLDEVDTVLFPGGIYNDGFGESWTRRVGEGAEAYGQGWERALVDEGDQQCEANQRLRGHNPDLIARIEADPYSSDMTARRSPLGKVSTIDVPVFLAGAWQDEQTGGRWPALIDELSAAPVLRVMMYNGLHGDAISPEVLSALTEFYDLYLEDSSPGADLVTTLGLSAGLAAFYGDLLPVSFKNFDPADGDALRLAYGRDDPIIVLFEMGGQRANLPAASFRATFDSWPPAAAAPTTLFLQSVAGGFRLADEPLTQPGAATFTTVPEDGAITTGASEAQYYSDDPGWTWPASADGNRLVATTDPLATDLIVVGPASADLWVTVDKPDADIEVTLSEVAPDGSETYVQAGWLRLSRRALDGAQADELRPVITGTAEDEAPLASDGDPVLARVEIPPFAHAFRAGSSLRLTVDTPGASRPQWRFATLSDPAEVTVYAGGETPSAVVLSVLGGVTAPVDRPPCGTLRGQPCRPG